MKTSIFQKLAATFIVACMFTQLFIPTTHAQEVLEQVDANKIASQLWPTPANSKLEVPNFGIVSQNTALVVWLHIVMGTDDFMAYLESYAPDLHALLSGADLWTAELYTQVVEGWNNSIEKAILERIYLSKYRNVTQTLKDTLVSELRLVWAKAESCIANREQKLRLSELTSEYKNFVSQENWERARDVMIELDEFVAEVCESEGSPRSVYIADQCAAKIESLVREIKRATSRNLTDEVSKLNRALQAYLDTECSQEVIITPTEELTAQLAEAKRLELRPSRLDEPVDQSPVLPDGNLCDAGLKNPTDNIDRFASIMVNRGTSDAQALKTRIQALSGWFGAEDVRKLLIAKIDTMIDLLVDAQNRELVPTKKYLCGDATRRDLEPVPVEVDYTSLQQSLETTTVAVTNVLLWKMTTSRDLQNFTTEVNNMANNKHDNYQEDVEAYLTLATNDDYNLANTTAIELLHTMYASYISNGTFHSTISVIDDKDANKTAYRQGVEIAVGTALFTNDTYSANVPDGVYKTAIDFWFTMDRGVVSVIQGRDNPDIMTIRTEDRVTDFTIPQEYRDLIENWWAPVK